MKQELELRKLLKNKNRLSILKTKTMNPYVFVGLSKEGKDIITCDDICVSVILEEFNVTMNDILSDSRKHPLPHVRSVIFLFLNKFKQMNKVRIGKAYNRDHSTVIYSIRRLLDECEVNADERERILNLLSRLNAGYPNRFLALLKK